jgi:hypothetical protein
MAEEPEAPSRSTGKGIGSKLGKKLGPLPVWAWGLAGVSLAYLGYRYWSSKNAAASQSATPAVGAGTAASGQMADTGTGYQDSGSDQLSKLSDQLTTLQTQLNAGGGAPGGGLTNYMPITQAQWAANLGNIYQQLTPGVFTKYTGAVSLEKSPGFIPVSTSAGQVSGAAAPTTTTGPGASSGPSGIASYPSAAGSVAMTTPPPAVSPVTSGPVPSGPVPSSPSVPVPTHAGPLPASGPMV